MGHHYTESWADYLKSLLPYLLQQWDYLFWRSHSGDSVGKEAFAIADELFCLHARTRFKPFQTLGHQFLSLHFAEEYRRLQSEVSE